MEAVVAPAELQVSVEELPEKMVVGEAEILTVGLAAQISKTNPANASAATISMETFLRIFILHELLEYISELLACLTNAMDLSLRFNSEKYALQLPCQLPAKMVNPIGTMVARQIMMNNRCIPGSTLSQFGKVKKALKPETQSGQAF